MAAAFAENFVVASVVVLVVSAVVVETNFVVGGIGRYSVVAADVAGVAAAVGVGDSVRVDQIVDLGC